MTEQYPVSGGKMVIGPDGVSKRVTFRDTPTTPDERQALKKYDDLSPLEILRRLRTAEWNADVRQKDAEDWKATAQRLDGELRQAQQKLAKYAPDGYTVPQIVADLVAHAVTHGWKTLLQWSEEKDGAALLDIQIGRKADEGSRGPHWLYKLAWACEPGASRRSGSGLAQTPDCPQWHDAPSAKKIWEVIAANPARKAGAS